MPTTSSYKKQHMKALLLIIILAIGFTSCSTLSFYPRPPHIPTYPHGYLIKVREVKHYESGITTVRPVGSSRGYRIHNSSVQVGDTIRVCNDQIIQPKF